MDKRVSAALSRSLEGGRWAKRYRLVVHHPEHRDDGCAGRRAAIVCRTSPIAPPRRCDITPLQPYRDASPTCRGDGTTWSPLGRVSRGGRGLVAAGLLESWMSRRPSALHAGDGAQAVSTSPNIYLSLNAPALGGLHAGLVHPHVPNSMLFESAARPPPDCGGGRKWRKARSVSLPPALLLSTRNTPWTSKANRFHRGAQVGV